MAERTHHIGCHTRRGLILPVVMLMVILLIMLGAGFAFHVNAQVMAGRANLDRVQARLVADSGIQRVMLLLRTERYDVNTWYNNEELLRGIIVWRSGDRPVSTYGEQDELEDREYAWRFSIMADDPEDDEIRVRYGITDEASKLNLLRCSGSQFRELLLQVAPEETNIDELVDAFSDWRDMDDEPEPNGAEADYYASLTPAYHCRNANLQTVEELLLIRGFTPQLLWGEDYDRNGLLTENEDDGDARFPMDNSDGKLNRGLLPYVTVYSADANVANDNTPRISFIGSNVDRAALEEYFDDDIVDYIIQAGASSDAQTKLTSPAALYSVELTSGSGEGAVPIDNPLLSRMDLLPVVLDRLTTIAVPALLGRININTAPGPVLRAIDLTDVEISTVLSVRRELESEAKETIAWLLTETGGVFDNERFAELAPLLCARPRQFTIESIGYLERDGGERIGTAARIQAVIDMRGHVGQMIYYRDLTEIGIGYPLRTEEEEKENVTAIQV